MIHQLDPRMHQRLAVSLAGDIIGERIPAGAGLESVEQLAATHGVSRTVVRETLQALASAGLITIQHGKRTVVNGITEWRFLDPLVQRAMQNERLPGRLVRDLYDTRLLIEVEMARLCAQRSSKETVQALRSCIDRFRELISNMEDYESALPAVVALDREFHAKIGEGAGNVVLARIGRDAHSGLTMTWEPDRFDRALLESILRQHSKIARAIEDCNADAAADAMRRHIEWSLKDTLQARARRAGESRK